MSTSTGTRQRPAAVSQQSIGSKVGRWFGRNSIRIYAVLAFTYLFIPVAYTLVFSFNNSGRSNYSPGRGSPSTSGRTRAAPRTCARPWRPASRSASWPPLIATVLGTMIAFALARHRFRGRTATNLTIFLPMATPEVVMGASLLALFLNLKINLGFNTIVIAHVMFCISFVVVTVKARIAEPGPTARAGGDGPLRRRDADLPPDHPARWSRPASLAGALLAFSLSFDDFIITNFNSGTVNTFPKFVYVSSLRGIPAQANVIASAMFFIALIAVLIGQVVTAGRKRQKA